MSRLGGYWGRTIDPETGIPHDELRVAEQIALQLHELCCPESSLFGVDGAWRQVEMYIHNYDLSYRDQNRWWNFEKSEAMEQDWDDLYAKLRAAAGSPVGKRRRTSK
jgi:hypothetical protein